MTRKTKICETNTAEQRNADRKRKIRPVGETNRPKQSKTTRGKEKERHTAEREKADQKYVTQKQDAEEPRCKDLTISIRTVDEKEQNSSKIITARTVQIQTTEGRCEARLVEDDSDNRPIHKMMNLAR